MSDLSSQLGIIDWGIGGISIYKLIKDEIGDIPVSYFSDTGVTPYGKMAGAELVSRLDRVIEYLLSRDVTHIVIGCNAASTAIPFLRAHPVPVEGVIESAVGAVVKQAPTRLGLIGGRRTVLSGVYRRAFAVHGIAIKQRIAQPLSGLIESGDISSDKLRDTSERILAPLANCSHILLACTHYPAIVPVMQEQVSKTTVFIDPAASMLGKIKAWDLPTGGPNRFLTSGDPGMMKKAAQNAFGVTLDRVKHTSV
jgi:glutamate racemase